MEPLEQNEKKDTCASKTLTKDAEKFWDSLNCSSRITWGRFANMVYLYCEVEIPEEYHKKRTREYDEGRECTAPINVEEARYESLHQIYRSFEYKKTIEKADFVKISRTYNGLLMIYEINTFLQDNWRWFHGTLKRRGSRREVARKARRMVFSEIVSSLAWLAHRDIQKPRLHKERDTCQKRRQLLRKRITR